MSLLLVFFPVMVVLLLAKGFFSGSELALVSSDKLKLKTKAARGNKNAALLLKLYQHPESLLTTTLIGTNVSTMTLTVLGTATMIQLFGSGAEIIAIIFLTPLMLIFGEIVPKSVFQQRADTVALRIIKPLAVFRALVLPVVIIFSWTAKKIARKFGPAGVVVSPYATRQRLRTLLSSADKPIDATVDRERIMQAILLSEMTVGEVMIPLAQVVGADAKAKTREVLKLSRASGHRRIPVFEGNLSNITAIAHWTIWEELDGKLLKRPLRELCISPYFVSTLHKIDELLPIIVARRDNMAVAVDEFGTAVGIISLEDIMRVLLGDVAQQINLTHRKKGNGNPVQSIGNNKYVLEGNTRLAVVEELLDIELPTREFHSVAGLLTSNLRKIPVVGDSIEVNGYRFTVLEATKRAATKIGAEECQ